MKNDIWDINPIMSWAPVQIKGYSAVVLHKSTKTDCGAAGN